jgi:hypothetical protein
MSVSTINSSTQIQSLVRQIANTVDANKDGQVSISEFGDFIKDILQGTTNTSTSALSALATTKTGAVSASGIMPNFRGFDSSRAQSAAGTLKYDAYNVLKDYDPRDPTAMGRAYAILNAMHPGQYELDPQDNLMLTGTSDGYIGARPMNRDSDWTNRSQDWSWDWFCYNDAHPGPQGEVA